MSYPNGKRQEFLTAFAHGFNISEAAEKIGINRKTVYRWLEKYSRFKQAFEEVRDKELDLVEFELRKQIKAGSTPATIFYLECLGKKRGWVRRHELTGPGGGPIVYQPIDRFILPEQEDPPEISGQNPSPGKDQGSPPGGSLP